MSESTLDGAPVCLITGGSSGIGLATARLFSKNGYQIATCGRDKHKLEEASRLIAAEAEGSIPLTIQVDLNDPHEGRRFVDTAIEQFGRLDVLVNNAGCAPLAPFEEVDQQMFDLVMNVNLGSVFHVTQAAWKQMTKQGRGEIVNVSSMAAVDPFPGFSLYGSSKAWIDLLTVALAEEGAPKGIRVCSIRPGAVETPLLRGLFPGFPPEQCVTAEEVAQKIWSCVREPEQYKSGSAFEVTNQN